ncbi:MAG: isoprenylcysteine carboxylmethyltransferase family protein [Flavobacteriales bacterium]|jgi:protein-S-isoprenylcysteine O-methyltransferase Ste14|nr:isoprenylcysteine carboxylmethyltransferase family protein [Flavobacteriales bacterium]
MISLPSPLYFFIVLGISELGLALFKRSGGSAQRKDKGSFGMLWAVIGVSIFLAIHISIAWPQFGHGFSLLSYGSGTLLFALGIGLRWWSIIHLGRFFTVDVAIANDHTVVSDGPYRLVRHPSYSGALLAFLGLGILVHNWLAAILLLMPITAMFLWRMKVEEQALSAAPGAAYTDYMARTKRLVPFVY